MERNFKDAVKHRRSYYSLENESTITDDEIKGIIEFALWNLPSAYNSQSARIVLLLNDNHKKFWETLKDELRKITSPDKFPKTEQKIDASFSPGYGTILFYEDMATVRALQEKFPLYSEKFAVWSEHTSAIHQFTIWTMLEDAGMGASLQHYNPIIDEAAAKQWGISRDWKLIAQMPFGKPASQPGEKDHKPLNERFIVF